MNDTTIASLEAIDPSAYTTSYLLVFIVIGMVLVAGILTNNLYRKWNPPAFTEQGSRTFSGGVGLLGILLGCYPLMALFTIFHFGYLQAQVWDMIFSRGSALYHPLQGYTWMFNLILTAFQASWGLLGLRLYFARRTAFLPYARYTLLFNAIYFPLNALWHQVALHQSIVNGWWLIGFLLAVAGWLFVTYSMAVKETFCIELPREREQRIWAEIKHKEHQGHRHLKK
ncbi:MAG: hypothetical protein U0T84_06080 [Chitinophagales bacterium]